MKTQDDSSAISQENTVFAYFTKHLVKHSLTKHMSHSDNL